MALWLSALHRSCPPASCYFSIWATYDLELVRSAAPFFRVPLKRAQEIIEHSRSMVRQWPKLAKHLGISPREQNALAPAFKLA